MIPGGMSQLQVLCGRQQASKDHVQRLYTDRLLRDNHALTPNGKLEKP
jgi:hypothetical protein